MATKKINIEELERQCIEAEENFRLLQEQLAQAKKEKEAAEQAKLKAKQDARYKEVINAYENFEELRNKYVEDYGSFTFSTPNGTSTLWNWIFQ